MKILLVILAFGILAGLAGSSDYDEAVKEKKEIERIAECERFGGCDDE